MRKYLLPMLVCGAAGALLLVVLESGDDPAPDRPDDTGATQPGRDAPPPNRVQLPPPANTPTALGEHQWLRELERAMALDGEAFKRAYWYRQKLSEDIDGLLEDEKLTRNLLNLIRDHGAESDDPRKRDVLLPMLRVVRHPEATEMIREQYYEAKTREERMMLLEAMSQPYHDPVAAAEWGVEMALNGDDEEMRDWGYYCIDMYSKDDAIAVRAARQIYEATTRPEQSGRMLNAIAKRASGLEEAREFVRARFHRPQLDELPVLLGYVEGGWMDENDIAMLNTLARQVPAMGDILRERAETVRRELELKRRWEAEQRKRKEAEAEKDG